MYKSIKYNVKILTTKCLKTSRNALVSIVFFAYNLSIEVINIRYVFIVGTIVPKGIYEIMTVRIKLKI